MTWIYAYPAWLVMIAAIVLFGGIAVAMTASARRLIPAHRRRANDVAGPVAGVAGTLLAALLSFMLVGVWSEAVQADQSASNEASAVADLERVAAEMPPAQAAKLTNALAAYSTAVIRDEWPAMREGHVSAETTRLGRELLGIVVGYEPRTASAQLVQTEAIGMTAAIDDARRQRRFDNQQGIPMVLWAGMLYIVVVTLALTALFSIENAAAHFAMAATVGLAIAVVLVLTAEFDYPFRGDIQIPPHAWHDMPAGGSS